MKIFGIGLNKTGTTTLDECGKKLGYRVKGCDRDLLSDFRAGDLQHFEDVISSYDLFQDWPWPLMYKYLDHAYPGSKFILTTRITDIVWLESLKKHSMRTGLRHCRLMAYGYEYPHQNESAFLDQYNSHNKEVREYFSGRSSDFLEICWEKGDGWDKLCSFLGKEAPCALIPHANKAPSENLPPQLLKRIKINEDRLSQLKCQSTGADY